MQRRTIIGALAALPLLPSFAVSAPAPTQVHVYKSPDCGCCGEWVKHLEAAGFTVVVTATGDVPGTRRRLGMPDRLGACHSATVEGYLLEGHVPATEVRRLLAMRPKALGLAVPGMPVGSPGMEYGSRRDAYQVLLVDRQGNDSVFATYPR